MDSLHKVLADCQALLDKRDSRNKPRSAEAQGLAPTEQQPLRFEVLVFGGRGVSDLTDSQQPFDRLASYQSEHKLQQTRDRDARLYSSEAKQPPRLAEEAQTRVRAVPRPDSPGQARKSLWGTGRYGRASVLVEAPDEVSCSSIFIAEDSKLRLSGVNTRSHLEFGPSFRLKSLQSSAATLGRLSSKNQKKQQMPRERPESPGLIALEELSRDQLLQSISRRQQQQQQQKKPFGSPEQTRPASPEEPAAALRVTGSEGGADPQQGLLCRSPGRELFPATQRDDREEKRHPEAASWRSRRRLPESSGRAAPEHNRQRGHRAPKHQAQAFPATLRAERQSL